MAEEVWKDLCVSAGATGYILIPLNENRIGESKTEKLVRGLKHLSNPENSEFAQAD